MQFNYVRRHLIESGVFGEREVVSAPDVFRLIKEESETGSETQPESQPTSNTT